jgi:hypothetical protein
VCRCLEWPLAGVPRLHDVCRRRVTNSVVEVLRRSSRPVTTRDGDLSRRLWLAEPGPLSVRWEVKCARARSVPGRDRKPGHRHNLLPSSFQPRTHVILGGISPFKAQDSGRYFAKCRVHDRRRARPAGASGDCPAPLSVENLHIYAGVFSFVATHVVEALRRES